MTVSDSLPGVIVTQISVHDVDLNPAFIFSFAKGSNPGSKFAIDQSTGVVVLVKTLDFEEATEHELLIQISDSVHHTEGALIVRVLDVNDNPPVFSQDSYQVNSSQRCWNTAQARKEREQSKPPAVDSLIYNTAVTVFSA